MNTLEEQKKLSDSLLAACKAAGINNPKYITQDAAPVSEVWHWRDVPNMGGGIYTSGKGGGTRLNHPPYVTDWQESLLEWVEPQGEPLANVLARHPDHVNDGSKMIDMQDAIADAYRKHVGRCGLQTYAQTYRQGWQDALAWKAMAEKGGASEV